MLLGAGCSRDCPPGSARNAEDLCELFPADSAAPGQDSSETTSPPEAVLTYGDPLETINSTLGLDPGPSGGGKVFAEWVDAVVLGEGQAVLVGVTGTALLDMETYTILAQYDTNRAYRVDADPDARLVVAGTNSDGLRLIELDSGSVRRWYGGPEVGHEDVSIDQGRILVAWRSAGAWLLDTSFSPLAVLPATSATAAVIRGDRALYTDEETLILVDVADPTAPVELDRIALPGAGVDLDFDGTRVAVGLGGRGAVVLTVEADQLVLQGQLVVPGQVQSVSLDGDNLWMGAWEVTALAWLGEGGPVVVGHEAPLYSAMGLGARDGVAIVADWFAATGVRRIAGAAGPEIHTEDTQTFQEDGGSEQVTFTNYGAFPLDISLEAPGDGFSADPLTLSLVPGERGTVVVTPPTGPLRDSTLRWRVVTPPTGPLRDSTLRWSSSDPDEPTGTVRLEAPRGGVGEPHPDFELAGFTWPDTTLTSHRLSDYKGKAVFLAYWADY